MMSKRKQAELVGDTIFNDSAGWGLSPAQKAKRIRNKSRVYFIQQGRNGPIKIGLSSRPERRLINLQVANPDLLRLLGTIPGTREDETVLQDRFRHLHIQGEWYRPGSDLLDFISKVLDN